MPEDYFMICGIRKKNDISVETLRKIESMKNRETENRQRYNAEVETIVQEVLRKLGNTGREDFRTPEMSQGTAAANGGLVPVTMPLSLAVKLIERIEAKAAEWNMQVVTAVSDAFARPVAVHCMDGAYIGSFDVALNKTYTSIAFQMSTAQLGNLSRPGDSLYGIQFTNNGKIVIFGGGEVLKRGDLIVGALGVSGGSAQQDTALAAYGKSVFEDSEFLRSCVSNTNK